MKLLIVEDESIIREGLTRHPNWAGWGINEVRSASSAKEALDLLLTYTPDIVCTDIMMPGMNGLEMCRLIKKINPDTRFIILTGYDDKKFLKDAIDIGVTSYIEKPISINALREAVTKITSSSGTAADSEASGNYLTNSVVKYIQLHYFEPELTLNQIAEALYVTPQHLNSVFKADIGNTVIQYLTNYRIEKAKEFLSMPQYKLYEVSLLVGFSDSAYFAKIFKRKTGILPSDFRRNLNDKLL